MIRTFFLVVVFLGFLDLDLLAQQEQNLSLLFPVNEIANRNAFFNRKNINPSQINDTVRFDAYWLSHKEIAGYSDSPRDNLFSVSGIIFNTRNLYGIEFETYKNGEVKKQIITLSYGYKFRLNEKFNIKAGASFGFVKFSLPSLDSWYMQGSFVENNWGQSPCANAGVTFSWLNHNVGISYLNFIKSYYEYENIEYNLSNKIITANYFSTFKLSRNFKVSPELFLADYLGRINVIFNGTVSFREKYSLGFIYSRYDNDYGMVAKILIINKIEIGYLLEKIKESNVNAGAYAHNFKIGFIIK